MWNISMLKENAKSCIKSYYWVAVVVSLLFILLTGQGAGNSSGASAASSVSLGNSDYFEQFFDDYDSDYSYDYDDDYYDDYYDDYDDYYDFSDDEIYGMITDAIGDITGDPKFKTVMAVAGVIMLIAFILYGALSVFFRNPITTGYYRFFLDGRVGGGSIDKLFSSFTGGRYLKTVKTMFFYDLRLFLWTIPAYIVLAVSVGLFLRGYLGAIGSTFNSSLFASYETYMSDIGKGALGMLLYLLLLIPRLVKYYEYFLVPYIAAENPDIPADRIFQISKNTMQGEKVHCFALSLSFIGWFILGGIAGSILSSILGGFLGAAAAAAGMALVYPYYYGTLAEFYCCMKEKAFATGISNRDELDGLFGRGVGSVSFPQQGGFGQSGFGSNGFGQADFNGSSNFSGYQQTNSNVNTSGSYPAPPFPAQPSAPQPPDKTDEVSSDGSLFGENYAARPTVDLEKHDTDPWDKKDDDSDMQ